MIPALNEERNLAYLASRLPHDVDEIVFVDGDSADNTALVARELWPNGVHLRQTRKGKGNALACGFAAASGDIVVMIDADGSTDPRGNPALRRRAHLGQGLRQGFTFRPGRRQQ